MRPVGQLPGAKGDASMRDGRRSCKREKCRYGANTCVRPASPWGWRTDSIPLSPKPDRAGLAGRVADAPETDL